MLLKKIILLRHKRLIHPFIIIAESKCKILLLQCSSVEYDKENNNYSVFYGDYYKGKINGHPYIMDLDIEDGLKYHSQTDLNSIYSINKNAINKKNIKGQIVDKTHSLILDHYEIMLNENDVLFSKEIDDMLIATINKN